MILILMHMISAVLNNIDSVVTCWWLKQNNKEGNRRRKYWFHSFFHSCQIFTVSDQSFKWWDWWADCKLGGFK
jgi:hypothetical protein